MVLMVFDENSKMAEDFEKVFKLQNARIKLNSMDKTDRKYYLNMILSTFLISNCDSVEEAIGEIEIIKQSLIERFKR